MSLPTFIATDLIHNNLIPAKPDFLAFSQFELKNIKKIMESRCIFIFNS